MKKAISTLCFVSLFFSAAFAQLPTNWVDCTVSLLNGKTQPWPGGISGARCNRLNGDLYMDCIGFGIWKSTDKGTTWVRVDNSTVGGRLETGWAMDQDQENPARMAVFSLDGKAGWTTNGTTWTSFADVGRNWDYGSVDWAQENPSTIFACSHENGGKLFVSTNGGSSWNQLSVIINPGSALANDAMVGVMDASTLIYSNGVNGIQRSTDHGATWTQVSTINPRTRTPMLFNGKFYLGGANGLLVSTNKGATWQSQGTAVNVCQGPFFGADENIMVIVGVNGIYRTDNAGTLWTKIANMKPNVDNSYQLSLAYYWSTYAWDPINNCVYATAMANHGFRLDLPGSTSTMNVSQARLATPGFSIINSRIRSSVLFDNVQVLSVSGRVIYDQSILPSFSFQIPEMSKGAVSNSIIRITGADGTVLQSMNAIGR